MVYEDQYMDPTFPRRNDIWIKENIYHSWQFKIALFLEDKLKINFYMHLLTAIYLFHINFLKSLVKSIYFFIFFTGYILTSTQF